MRIRSSGWIGAVLVLVAAVGTSHASAQVVRLEVTSREPADGGKPVGAAGPYEILHGRIHGEVDPNDPHNRIIQDLQLAPRNERGKVAYVATFALAKPVDPAKASGVLIYQVVNRGNGTVATSADGDISLVSGWQGDVVPTATNQTISVPIARNADGSSITGPAIARFYNIAAGTNTVTIHLSSMGAGPPVYPPASLDRRTASLTSYTSETYAGVRQGATPLPADAWAFADCATRPFPGVPDPTKLCLQNGFQPTRLYELVYTAKDPLVLGVGLAATRDINAFFRYAARDDAGAANPVAGIVKHAISVGDSQSGNMIKTFVHLGFNEDLTGRIVWEGVFPRIAGRQTPINLRFALPGGAAGLFEPGSEPPVWWGRYEDPVRHRPAASLLDRCQVEQDMSEGDRSIRIDGAVGAADVTRLDRHGRQGRHSAAGQRPEVLLPGNHARRRPWRIQRRGESAWTISLQPARQSKSGVGHDAGLDESADRLGELGHRAA